MIARQSPPQCLRTCSGNSLQSTAVFYIEQNLKAFLQRKLFEELSLTPFPHLFQAGCSHVNRM